MVFSKTRRTISPNHRPQFRRAIFSKIAKRFFLQNDFSKSPTHFFTEDRLISVPLSTEHVSSNMPMYLAKRFLQTAGYFTPNIRVVSPISGQLLSFLFSSEKTQPLISPYTCHGLHALRYGWSAVVPWSCLFLLHVHGLRARHYGLWAS